MKQHRILLSTGEVVEAALPDDFLKTIYDLDKPLPPMLFVWLTPDGPPHTMLSTRHIVSIQDAALAPQLNTYMASQGTPICTRREADERLFTVARTDGMHLRTALIMWLAVRLCGRKYWRPR